MHRALIRKIASTYGIAVALIGTSVGGCASPADDVAPDPQDPKSPAPIWSIGLSDGSSVELYASKGVLLLAGELPDAAQAQLPDLREAQTIVDVYRALAPDQDVPEAITAAQARYDSSIEAGDEVPVGESVAAPESVEDQPAEFVLKHSAAPWRDEWCDSARLEHSSGVPSGSSCEDHRTGGGTWYNNCYKEHFSAVRPYLGAITYRMRIAEGAGPMLTFGTWDVPEGTTRWARAWGPTDCSRAVENIIFSTTSSYDRAWLVGKDRPCGNVQGCVIIWPW